MRDVALAALIVNYNTGSYAECCVDSLLHEWQREGRPREKLTIVLVDNASPDPQEPHLSNLEARGVTVIRSSENLGYARGINACYERTQGAPGDVVAILNPDLHFLPGTIERLIDYLFEHQDCGVVDPSTCIDALGVFNLPRNLLPTPLEHARVTLAQLHPFFCRLYSRRRLKRAMVWWTSPEPVETDMLSGCCLFMRRAVVEELGRPMDPRYPLYFEDTDLFLTLRERGYKVVHHTGARILHHWSRSARVGGPFEDEPTRRYELSRAEYFKKFYGPFGRFLVEAVNRLARRWPREKIGRPMMPLVDLGELVEPVEIRLPRSARFLIEIAIHPTFVICCGIFGTGERWRCPADSWDWLFKLEYYLRAIDLDSGAVLGGWRFTKVPEGRMLAMHQEEIESYGERLLSAAPHGSVR
jgi:GT2 family glycosyltransferase